VLRDDEACQPANAVQYWMYNGISHAEQAEAYARSGIQYKLTLLYPARLGDERSKTLDHIHAFPPDSRLNDAEVCEVVYGEAIFLFQTLDLEKREAPFCYAVRAKQGDKVLFPPNTHHLTINAGDDMLLFSDLINVRTRGNYYGLSAMGGAAYLYGQDGWRPNPNYQSAAPLDVFDAQQYPDFHLTRDVPLYKLISLVLEKLDWLTKPELFYQYFPDEPKVPSSE
jgi:oxalate decarboxylase/phosphoglucose isomerase-like protein (cupin superfamily)